VPERIVHNENTQNGIYSANTVDKERQYTCLYNARTTKILSKSLMSLGMSCL